MTISAVQSIIALKPPTPIAMKIVRPEDLALAIGNVQCPAFQPIYYELNTASQDTAIVFTILGFIALIILIVL